MSSWHSAYLIKHWTNFTFFLPNIIRVITSKRMSWAGHVVHVRDKRSAYKVLIKKCGRRDTRKTKGLTEG
jgi:hypothetical protein